MKLKSVTVLLLLISGMAFAQVPYTEVKVGRMDPESSRAGNLFGITIGRTIDESLSYGVELNYFQKNFKDEVSVLVSEDGGIKVVEKIRNFEQTTHILPILVKLNYEHPLGFRKSPVYLRASAGLGWEFVWNKENNYVDNIHKTRFFNGVGWQLSTGLGLAISSSGNAFIDLFYNDSRVKRNKVKNEVGLPTWEELNVSGFGIKVGVSLVGFGF